jgi:hypothetical protein
VDAKACQNNPREAVTFVGVDRLLSVALFGALWLTSGCSANKHVRASIPEKTEPSAPSSALLNGETLGSSDTSPSLPQPPVLPFSTLPGSPLLPSWFPLRMSEQNPHAEGQATCALNAVLDRARQRVDELIANMNRFTATEELIHENLTEGGRVISTEKRRFDYVASITTLSSGDVAIEEFRNRDNGPSDFPDGIATQGLPALMFVFLRRYQPDYDFSCEGVSNSDGSPAWVVYFRQRSDKPRESLRYVVDNRSYNIAIEGRAWIATDTFHLLRMESDVVKPVPRIRLTEEHEVIIYKPVTFKEKNVKIWLPASADLYFCFRRHLYHRIQAFRSYMLFSVSATETIGKPPPLSNP